MIFIIDFLLTIQSEENIQMTHPDQEYFDFLDKCEKGKWHKATPLAKEFNLSIKEAIKIVARWIKHSD